MTTTTKSPIETAMKINTTRWVNYLIERIEMLVRMQIQLQERFGTFASERPEWDYIIQEMKDTRNELVRLATK